MNLMKSGLLYNCSGKMQGYSAAATFLLLIYDMFSFISSFWICYRGNSSNLPFLIGVNDGISLHLEDNLLVSLVMFNAFFFRS